MTKPWQPQGNVHALSGFAITRLVPTASGVYGLHNEHQQLFIGEAANLRETLLLHWEESENLFRGRQPTHFAFEVCGNDARAQRAQTLIATHRPAIQSLQLLTLADLPNAKSKRRAALQITPNGGAAAGLPQWPQTAITADTATPSKYFSRAQLAILVALFIVTAGVSGFLGVVTGQTLRARRVAELALAAARRPVLADLTAEEAQTALESNSIGVSRDDGSVGAKPGEVNAATAAEVPLPVQVAKTEAANGDAAAAIAKRVTAVTPLRDPKSATAESHQPAEPSASQEAPATSWSVQVAATQDQKAAQQMQDKLKNKGFDAYIVEAELDSGRWYRLRVGRFGAQQEAEATRQALQSKENIRSAFVTAK